MEKQSLQDDGSVSKYAAVIPHIADDDLDPFEYRLYGHYKKVLALSGSCDESIRETSKATQMHTKSVSKARDGLAKKGYITAVKPTPAEARKGKTIHVTLVDRWPDNMAHYAYAKGVAYLPQPVSKLPQVSYERIRAVVNTLQVNTDFKSLAVANMLRIDSKDSIPNGIDRPSPKTTPASQINPIKDAIVTAFKWTWATMSSTEKGTVSKAAKILADANITPDHVPALYQECVNRKWTKFSPMALTKVVSDVMSRLIKLADDEYIPVAQRTSALDGVRLIS